MAGRINMAKVNCRPDEPHLTEPVSGSVSARRVLREIKYPISNVVTAASSEESVDYCW